MSTMDKHKSRKSNVWYTVCSIHVCLHIDPLSNEHVGSSTQWFWGFLGSLAPHLGGKYWNYISKSLPKKSQGSHVCFQNQPKSIKIHKFWPNLTKIHPKSTSFWLCLPNTPTHEMPRNPNHHLCPSHNLHDLNCGKMFNSQKDRLQVHRWRANKFRIRNYYYIL